MPHAVSLKDIGGKDMTVNWCKVGLVAGGALLGSYGAKILGSKTMKAGYTHTAAAVLRMKDEVVKDFTVLKENCDDIAADAREINEERLRKEEEQMIQDAKDLLAQVEADSKEADEV